jgi:hypothetical protein
MSVLILGACGVGVGYRLVCPALSDQLANAVRFGGGNVGVSSCRRFPEQRTVATRHRSAISLQPCGARLPSDSFPTLSSSRVSTLGRATEDDDDGVIGGDDDGRRPPARSLRCSVCSTSKSRSCRGRWRRILAGTRMLRSSCQPGVGTILGSRVLAEFGDAPGRYTDAKDRKNNAGTSPIPAHPEKKKVVLAPVRAQRPAHRCAHVAGPIRAAGLARRARLRPQTEERIGLFELL